MSSGIRNPKKPKKHAAVKSFEPSALREAMRRLVQRRTVVTGQITVPAVPGMIDEYIAMCCAVFADVGRGFSPEEIAHARRLLGLKLEEAFAASPRSNVVISFNAPVGTGLNYEIKGELWTVTTAYENWLSTRTPPLFGTEPDARVWTLANEVTEPKGHRILDIGAGTGRNALALARRGHPVDAVESTPKFARILRTDAEHEALNVRVIEGDIFDSRGELARDYGLVLLSEVISDFRNSQQLRNVFELAAERLATRGRLVFNVFLAKDGYLPDRTARELGQQCYTSIFTRQELLGALANLPLLLLSDDSVYEFEKTHLPDGAWPPTGWYADWVRGFDLFGTGGEKCPIEMRWLVFEKN